MSAAPFYIAPDADGEQTVWLQHPVAPVAALTRNQSPALFDRLAEVLGHEAADAAGAGQVDEHGLTDNAVRMIRQRILFGGLVNRGHVVMLCNEVIRSRAAADRRAVTA